MDQSSAGKSPAGPSLGIARTFEHATIGMALLGLDGTYLHVNPRLCQILGYDVNQLRDLHFQDVSHPEDRPRALDRYKRLIAGEVDAYSAETRLIHADGHTVWVHVDLTVEADAEGQSRHCIAIVQDITERKRASDALHQQVNQQAAISDLGMYILQGDRSLDDIVARAVDIVTDTLGMPFCEILRLLPDDDGLLLEDGTGWMDGYVGHAVVGTEYESQAGYTLQSDAPVVVPDFARETRFHPPDLLLDHNVRSGITVLIEGRDRPWGVLGVHDVGVRDFTKDAVLFVQAVANVVGEAVRRHDIAAERERLITALDAERKRLTRMFVKAPAFIAVLRGPDHVFEFANDRYNDLVGNREIIGRPVREALPEIEGQDFFGLLDYVIETGEIVTRHEAAVKIQRRPHGPLDLSYVTFVYQPLTEHDGTISGIFVHGVEVTDQVEARMQIEQLADEAERHLTQLEAVIGSMTEGLVIAAPDGRVLTMNPAALELHGIDDVSLIQAPLSDLEQLFTVYDLDGRRLPVDRWPLARVAAGESIADLEVEVRHRDSGRSWIGSYNGTPVRNTSGEVILHIVTIRDVTEQKEAQETLRQAKEDAEAANRAKGEFLANMSHEIRTPLTGILGFASILAERVTGEERRFAELIERSGHRLLDTLNAVLTLAKLEANDLELNVTSIDVAQQLRDIVELFQVRADERGLGLSMEVAPDADGVKAHLDRGGLDSILNNLIGNAIKFTDDGTVTVRMRTEQTGNCRQLLITVEDTGEGIDAEFIPHLFDSFRQESTGLGRHHEGSGLGLAISQRLVTQMGGHIEVDSEKGVGSTFTLRFPVAEGPVDPEAVLSADTGTARILVVDDNPDMTELMTQLLTDHEIVTARNAESALAAARDSGFDLALLDINLGRGPDGVRLLEEMRQLPDYATTPILAVTAYALPNNQKHLLDAGFDDYLSKPFTADALIELVDRHLTSITDA